MQKILPDPNSFVNLLVKRLEECCGDGLDCDHCPVAAECTACWDAICQQLVLDEYQYSDFVARLDELRNRKRDMASNKPGEADSRGKADAGKVV